LSRGDVKTALANFRISHATDPDNREALYGLAATLELSGDKPAARAVRATAGNLDRLSSLTQRAAAPGARANAGLMRELGEACAVMNRKGEARAWYKLAITLNPLDAESQRALFRLSDAGPHDAEPAATQPTR
jgi:tetratricopeptide (TPR) repeat protein